MLFAFATGICIRKLVEIGTSVTCSADIRSTGIGACHHLSARGVRPISMAAFRNSSAISMLSLLLSLPWGWGVS